MNIRQILAEMTQPLLKSFSRKEIIYWVDVACFEQKPVCVSFLGSTSKELGLGLDIEFKVTKVVFGPDYMKVVTQGPINAEEIRTLLEKFEGLGIQITHAWESEERKETTEE